MNSYVAIRSEGGLIPIETIEKAVRKELPGQTDRDFGLEKGRRLSDEIARAWSDALDYWHIFRRRMEALPAPDLGTTLTRERWVLLLLTDLLGYELTYQAAGAQIGGKTYPISHRARDGEEALPVHVVGFRQDLDRRDESGHRRMSPHALVQEYVNRSEHLWATVTNGLRFRLLRDTTRTARPTYLEFNLQSILDGGRFNEFAIFYRLCHRTRLPKTIADAKDCLLEQYYQASIDEGLRVRDRLRDAVEVALKRIGTGLLRHPSNEALRQKITSGLLTSEAYYRQLLRLIYRLLFLMVAEERQMLYVPGHDAEKHSRVYDRFYSLRRLRDLAEKPIKETLYDDAWIGLHETFRLFTNGQENPLGMPLLNGYLFGPEAVPDLEGTHLNNHDLLMAIRRMSVFETDGAPARVNYAGLDVEELGSVYESLLDFQPTIERQNADLVFDLKTGTERKSTGSYYTPRELVSELVGSVLVPVLDERLKEARTNEEQEEALLSIAICDPACGSGHFLLAAARRLARELARVRTGEEEPTPETFRKSLRDVIQHCLYAVDKNPLAVDLCKVALWIEGHNPGLPLSFLDHKVKCGDSLVGVFSIDELARGIPDVAFTPVFGDERDLAREIRRRNSREQSAAGEQLQLFRATASDSARELSGEYSKLDKIPQVTVQQIHEAAHRFEHVRATKVSWYWTAANLWTAAFFLPITKSTIEKASTTRDLLAFIRGDSLSHAKIDAANRLAEELRFIHWFLEFPDVFARGGFDVVLGNPPWDRIRFYEEEFFEVRDRAIATAPNKAARESLIGRLSESKPSLYKAYEAAKHYTDAQAKFVRAKQRYALTAVGDLNTYALFTELGRNLLRPTGRLGFVVPTGLATDDGTKAFFADLMRTKSLVSFLGMENEAMVFPGIHHSTKFGLLTLSGSAGTREDPTFTFFCRRVEWIVDSRRRFSLNFEDINLLNPNSQTCPVFRTRADADLGRILYKRIPVLVNERTNENAWGASFRQGLFNMSTDSGLFRTRRQLEDAGYRLTRNRFARGDEVWIPLYEAKMFHQFDHRWGDYAISTAAQIREGSLAQPSLEDRRDPEYAILPRYWVLQAEVERRLAQWPKPWLVAFRDVASAVVERTVICTILPRVGVGNNAPLLYCHVNDQRLILCLIANMNSLAFDYIARQKLGGTHLNFFILRQLPVLEPRNYVEADVGFISQRVLELLYTSEDLKPFVRELGNEGRPFTWDEARRALVRAEIDAYYAHLYGLSRDQLLYILDPKEVHGSDFPGETFRVLKEREEREFGEYRTRRLVVEAYDDLATSRFSVTAALSRGTRRNS